jgi:hypothetical protein
MKKNKIFIILVACFTLTACQSVKDGLSGNKNNNSDEFLIQKKNPLVLPPKYSELPKPQDSVKKNEKLSLNEDNLDIQKMFGTEEEVANSPSSQNRNVEEFILKNIKDD